MKSVVNSKGQVVSLWLLVLTVTAGFSLGQLVPNIVPQSVTAFVFGWGMNAASAGSLVGFEIILIAITAFVMSLIFLSPSANPIPPARFAVMGALILIAAHSATVVIDNTIVLWVCRLLGGIGGGLIVFSTNAVLARYFDPDRLVGLALTFSTLLLVMLQYAGGMVQALDYRYFFFVIAGLGVLLLPALSLLPDLKSDTVNSGKGSISVSPKALTLLFIATALIIITEAGMWAFSSTVATNLGMAPEDIGLLLGASSLMIMVGSIISSIIGSRFGRLIPLLIGGLGVTLTSYSVITATDLTSFQWAMYLNTAFYGIALPYSIGLAASIDTSGRVVNWSNSLVLLFGGISPVLLGYVMQYYGMETSGLLLLICGLVSLVLFAPVALQQDRANKG